MDKRFNAERKQIRRRTRTKERLTIYCDSKVKRKKRKKERNKDRRTESIAKNKERKKRDNKEDLNHKEKIKVHEGWYKQK